MYRSATLIFQYGVELQCVAIRASKRRDMESERGTECVPGESISTQVVYGSTKHREVADEQFVAQLYPRHVRRVKYLGSVQAREAVIPVALRKRFAQFWPKLARHCPVEI